MQGSAEQLKDEKQRERKCAYVPSVMSVQTGTKVERERSIQLLNGDGDDDDDEWNGDEQDKSSDQHSVPKTGNPRQRVPEQIQ